MARARVRLEFLEPHEREILAQWIEQKVRNFPATILRGQEVLATQGPNPALARSILYWQDAVSFSKKLAYDVRTERKQKPADVTKIKHT